MWANDAQTRQDVALEPGPPSPGEERLAAPAPQGGTFSNAESPDGSSPGPTPQRDRPMVRPSGVDLANASSPYSEGLFMHETIWDAALLIGLQKEDNSYLLTWFQAVVVVILLAATVVIQAALVSSTATILSSDPLTSDVETAVVWQRLFELQQYDEMDFTDVQSRSRRLCSQLVYTTQARLNDDIEAYIEKERIEMTNAGAFIAGAAMIIFSLSMIREFYRIFDVGIHVLFLERCPRGATSVRSDARGTAHVIHRMSWPSKAFSLLIVLLPRALQASILLWAGLAFVARTLSVEDLILNAVALEVVKNVGEFVMMALVTRKLRNAVTRTRFARFNDGHGKTQDRYRLWGVSYRDVLSTLARFAFLAIWVLLAKRDFLGPFLERVEAFHENLCGKDLDFVWKSHPVTQLPFFADVGAGDGAADPTQQSLVEQVACFSGAGADMFRVRAGFDARKSAPNQSLVEMLRGESEHCTRNGGSLVCPELTLFELVRLDSVSKEEYFAAESCTNYEVHMAMTANTCGQDQYAESLPWFAGRRRCDDFAEVCQCTSYDEDGYCSYTNVTAIQENYPISRFWVELLQEMCPRSCNTCQLPPQRRRLLQPSVTDSQLPERKVSRAALPPPSARPRLHLAQQAGHKRRAPRLAAPPVGRHTATLEQVHDDGAKVAMLERRVAALERINAELEQRRRLAQRVEERIREVEARLQAHTSRGTS